jgi:hypothetical protein
MLLSIKVIKSDFNSRICITETVEVKAWSYANIGPSKENELKIRPEDPMNCVILAKIASLFISEIPNQIPKAFSPEEVDFVLNSLQDFMPQTLLISTIYS